ncbi:glycosyltransferase 87 family protein [Kribbella sp. NPDC056861]|uniref:glycosyltransferase 87 family protein n=1 Tax=Kribbella sp. NPDC056861 TaxID=3154857 RepID=UPI003442B8B8
MITGSLGDPVKRRWWLAAGVCVVVAAALPFLWDHTGADLKVYRLGGAALLADPSSLYTTRLRYISMPFTYPIFGGVVMAPVSLLPWPLAYGASIAASLVALVAVWRLSLKQALKKGLHPAVMIAVAAASLLIEPVRETVSYGQINLILCAVILYDVLGPKSRTGRGIWLGLAAGIKLTPLVFFGLLLVTRQWKALAHASAAFAATVLIGFLITPRTAYEYWTSLLADTSRIGGLAYSGNQSWNGFLIRVTGHLEGGGRLWQVVVLMTVVAGLWLSRNLWRRGEQLAAVSVTATIGLFCSPVSWSHHWVWCIPLGVSLLTASKVGRRWPLPTALTWMGLFVLAPIWWPPRGDNRELSWNSVQLLAGNAYLWLSLVAAILLAVGRLGKTQVSRKAEMSERRQPTGPDPHQVL